MRITRPNNPICNTQPQSALPAVLYVLWLPLPAVGHVLPSLYLWLLGGGRCKNLLWRIGLLCLHGLLHILYNLLYWRCLLLLLRLHGLLHILYSLLHWHCLLLLLLRLIKLHQFLGWLIKALATWRMIVELTLVVLADDPRTQREFFFCLLHRLLSLLCLHLLCLHLLCLQLLCLEPLLSFLLCLALLLLKLLLQQGRSLTASTKLQLSGNTSKLRWYTIRALLRQLVEIEDALLIFTLLPSTAKITKNLRLRLHSLHNLLLHNLLLRNLLLRWGIAALLCQLIEVVNALLILTLQPPTAQVTKYLSLSCSHTCRRKDERAAHR